MSNSDILDPDEQNRQLLARLWDGLKRRDDGKCYFPCSQCKGFKRRRILITTTRKHCAADMDMLRGGMNIIHL